MSAHDDGEACPLPLRGYPLVLQAHGGGGRLARQLIERIFIGSFDNPCLAARHDGAILDAPGGRLAFSTDAYVARPLFFPGGDIGTLAVYGTANDLAMCGARPVCLSAAFILEEGLAMETVWRVARAMRAAADAVGAPIVTGDTKVIERRNGGELLITTSGIGAIEHELTLGPAAMRAGDALIVSGDLGRHGIAIMSQREGLTFEAALASDLAYLGGLTQELLAAGTPLTCLRDLTRGGLTAALAEIAEAAKLSLVINEDSIPVREEVRGACEILGLDPLYTANEGRFLASLPAAAAPRALEIMRRHPLGAEARLIGEVAGRGGEARVTLVTRFGAARLLDLPAGDPLPRIC